MRIFRHYDQLPPGMRGGVVALGNFDGVHRGHQAVIGRALERARARGGACGVMTFEPHPRAVFKPDQPAFRLTPFRVKARHVESLGPDFLWVQHFDRDFSTIEAEDFVRDVLWRGLGVKHVVVGYDYVFGHNRRGTVKLLEEMAADCGFGVTEVEPVTAFAGGTYSSTRVRTLLADGHVKAAAQLLGRFWEIDGRVEHGDKRGRTIGFPTANLQLGEYLHPAGGVYAVRAGVERDGETEWHDGVANFGNRPTFDKTDVLLEVHLLDFDGDLYGQHLRVALIDRLRDERRFDGLDALKTQISRDADQARAVLADLPSVDRDPA